MKKVAVSIFFVIFQQPSFSEDLQPLDNQTLSQAIAFGSELANSSADDKFGHLVRLVAFPVIVGECGGPIASCPDWRLIFVLTTGDLGGETKVFELPISKGWEFVSWNSTPDPESGSFSIKTGIPSANIDSVERQKWRAVEYRVVVSVSEATVEIIPGDA